MKAYSATTLISRAKRRCDKENDPSISDSEWADILYEAYGPLFGDVVDSGYEYFETSTQLTSTGVNTLSVPSDHYKTVLLAYLADAASGRYVALRELQAQERTVLSGLNVTAGSRARAFILVGQAIYLYPTPPTGQIYELRYVQQPTDFTTSTASIDVVTPDGLAYLLWNTAVIALSKSESDVTVAAARAAEARDRFLASCQRSLTASRRRILDIEVDGGYLGDWGEGLGW